MKDFRLVDMNMTSDQLFFVYYALDNCERADSRALRRLPLRLPGRERVNVPLRHYPPFAKQFNCRPGDAMVAAKPCRLP